MTRSLVLYTDGACSGNPGEAGIGVVLLEKGAVIAEISLPIGLATNNIAEYTALIYGLQEALKLKADEVTVYTDSELMHRQMTGRYRVKDANMKRLYDQANHLVAGFVRFEIHHVRREHNKEADRLATSALSKAAESKCGSSS